MPKLYPGYRDEVRKKIVSEAFEVFLSKGFEKTTMEEIAARLGVTKTAIYRYYPSKEELFLTSMVETMIGEFKNVVVTSFASGDLITGAGTYFDGLLEFDRKYSNIGKEIESIISRKASLQTSMDELHSDGLEFMRQFINEQKKRGTIRTTIDDDDLVLIISTFARGLTNSVRLGLDPVEAKRLWLLGFAQIVDVRNGKA